MKAVQNRNGLRTFSHSRIPPVTPLGVGLAALAVGVSSAGAISYVLKDINPNQLVEAVRRGVQGEYIMHPRVAARVVNEIRATEQASSNPFSELSERELEVLRLIARGLTNAEIAERLFISEKTVKGHVSNILSKLHMLDRTKAAVFAWEQGFMRPNQEKIINID
nr:response regulator transcription factor [Bacillus nitratireducens]